MISDRNGRTYRTAKYNGPSMDKTVEAANALSRLGKIVTQDVEECKGEMKANDTQRHRRAYVRAAISSIEAFTWLLKSQVISHRNAGNLKFAREYSIGEIAMLNEETYELQNKTTVIAKLKMIPVADNFVFAVTMFAGVYDSEFKLDIGVKGWEHLKAAIGIRHRITHPKDPDAMTITDDELLVVDQGTSWAAAAFMERIIDFTQHLRRETKKLRDRPRKRDEQKS